MKTFLRQYSKPAVSILLALVLMTSTLVTGVIAAGGYKATVKESKTEAAAVSAADSKTTSVEAETDNSADTAVKNTAGSAVNKKKDKKQTGANAKNLTGYSTFYVRGSWDKDSNNAWKSHNITSSSYSVQLEGGTNYQFVYTAENNDQFSSGAIISGSVSNYNFSRNDNDAITLHTTIAGTYTFSYNGMDGGGTSISINITFPANNTPDTWTVAGGTGGETDGGQEDALFTSTWDASLTQNNMTNTSGTTWTWTKSNVTLPVGNILFKVVKNHDWNTASYPASNQSYNIATAGSYNVTITFDSSSHDVTITVTAAAKSTLTVQNNIDYATVTATYNGTTVGENQSISNVPEGATVSISVTPDSGYQCTAVTGTYNTNSTVSGTGSGKSWSLVMPAADTTVSVTLGTVTMKRIYFNNNYTQYGTVYAYVYDKSGSNHTYKYLGDRPGKVMIEPENSEIWYIEVPSDVDYVEFISGDGKTTGELTIPWGTHTYPKYTAPYNYDAPTTANGGTWDNYIWGDKMGDTRDNVYTVSDGSTMNGSNLFTGITATLFDYYTDGEITASAGTSSDTGASGAPNGWIKGIQSNEYTWDNYNNNRVPYTKLNAALSAYADADKKSDDTTSWTNPHQPKYGVTYPLYFGDLNTNDGGNSVTNHVATLYNWNYGANNSTGLTSGTDYAAVGLSGKKLGDDNTIHYYKSGATDENGAPMAMFNEDFLSGENSEGKPLATILRTSSFPVRKEENVGSTVTSITKLHLDPTGGSWTDGNAVFDAYFWGSNLSGTWKQFSGSGTDYVADIPAGAQNVIITRNGSHVTSFSAWNQSEDISLTLSGDSAKNKVQFTGWNDGKGTFTSSLDTSLTGCTVSAGHTYYEFKSNDGTDNAYIESIDKSAKTAEINYYDSSQNKTVKSAKNTKGFFPFNYSGLVPDTAHQDYAQDLGFGMKLTIPFTLNGSNTNNGLDVDNTHQTFDFSGDDDLWVFVDGKLVLDLGGAHGRTEGSIDFYTKTVTANKTEAIPSGITAGTDRNGSFATGFNTNENYVHTMTIYYMERGMIESNLKFGFSFHAIPNQFWIDKKVRTKDKYNLGYDTINSGFFTNNNQTGNASNFTTYTVGDKITAMSKFEKSFQNEQFTVTHWYGTSSANTLASGKNYTIDNDSNTHTTGSDGQYPIYNDLGNAFIGQFTKDDKFKLKETISNSNKYVYTPVFSVWDQANNDQAITFSGNNNDGYTFDFSPTTTVTNGIENTNIKARFDNYMSAHDLVLTKELTNATDTTTSFDFQILFDFDGTGYVSYPLYYTHSNGTRAQLSNTGTVSLKAGESITIDKIPDKAKVKVVEILPKEVAGYRYVGMTAKNGTTALSTTAVSSVETNTITKGATFTTSDKTTYVTFSNKKPDNKYIIKYTYPSYDNKYGNQSYTVTGVFTKSELNTYMQLDGSGGIQFKTTDLKKTFINTKSPYEDNFMQSVSFADASIDDTSSGKGWVNGNYIADATANTTNDQINVYFNLPYEVNNLLVPVEFESTGRVKKIDAQAVGSKKIDIFDWYVTSGKKNANDTSTAANPVYVKAPLMLYTNVSDTSTVRYFQYWSVKKLSGYGMKAAEYTRCYDYEFNLSLFMDCYIEPVYDTTWAQNSGNPNPPSTYDNYKRFDPELQITGDSTKGISIAFLENSRNQWNNDDGGTKTGLAADTIYSDFLLSFNKVAGITQLNELSANTKNAGIVIEAVNNLVGSNAEGFNSSKDYSSDTNYTNSESAQRDKILEWLATGTKPNGINSVNKTQFDVTELDNKNCIQYYTSIKNRNVDSLGTLLNTSNNRYKVYRAYAYIGDVSGSSLTNVTLSDPVYFTIYDIGKLYDLADNKS